MLCSYVMLSMVYFVTWFICLYTVSFVIFRVSTILLLHSSSVFVHFTKTDVTIFSACVNFGTLVTDPVTINSLYQFLKILLIRLSAYLSIRTYKEVHNVERRMKHNDNTLIEHSPY